MTVLWPWLFWYVLTSALGLVAFPLIYRLLPALPGRGYAFARAFGLLLWAYIFWLLGSLGVLRNDGGGLLFALVLMISATVWAWRKIDAAELLAWWREQRRLVIAVEVLFLLAFLALAWFRALDPNIVATEKPMELAFINAIMRSPTMPPHDPWLADYAISYYYFGYVMVAMLAKITLVSSGVAFNLGVALIFALTAIGTYGLVYDLLQAYRPQKGWLYAGLSLLSPVFIIVVSNVEGFLEWLHRRGLFWQQDATGEGVSPFWAWLDIKDLVNAPAILHPPGEQPRFWWWWRASRVVNDYSLQGGQQEVIDEFPFFSLYLGDLHPHVLTMPFVLLAIALALNLFLSPPPRPFRLVGINFHFDKRLFALGALVFGGLAFLNIWDFPLYVGLFAGAYLLQRTHHHGWGWERVGEFFLLGLALGAAGGLLYLPFYLGFSSQAGGILPNLINPTSGGQLWVMFGTLLLPLFFFLLYVNTAQRDRTPLIKGLLIACGLALALFAFSILMAFSIVQVVPSLSALNPAAASVGDWFLASFGVDSLGKAYSLGEILQAGILRRLASPGGLITLLVLLGMALAVVWPRREVETPATSNALVFAGLLILFGGLLVLMPEFVYLRDNFGTRMNTIFKFYFQTWLLWGVAAAFGSALILADLKRRKWAIGYFPVLLFILVVGFTYSVYGIETKLHGFRQQAEPALRLDGTLHQTYLTPDDHLAVAWLQQAPLGTLVEAVGGSYTGFARISTHSGQPALLGWPGHENQWRGGGSEMGSRFTDIERLYTVRNWEEAKVLLSTYDVRYLYVGPLEHITYDVNQVMFDRFLTPVYQNSSVTIYLVPPLTSPLTLVGQE